MRRRSSGSLYAIGSEHVEGVNAISGERCSPHPHVYSDRILRPGDPAYFDITHATGLPDLLLPHVRRRHASRPLLDAYKRCRDYLDAAIALVRPGVTTARVASCGRGPRNSGSPTRRLRSRCSWARHRPHVWEKPIVSRLVSLDHPELSRRACRCALETFWPASDGWSAARIEEQLIVTNGCEVITRFPAEDLLIAGQPYFTAGGVLRTARAPVAPQHRARRLQPGGDPAHSAPRRVLGAVGLAGLVQCLPQLARGREGYPAPAERVGDRVGHGRDRPDDPALPGSLGAERVER